MHKQTINDINICSDFEVCTGGDDKRGSVIHVAEFYFAIAPNFFNYCTSFCVS